MNEHVLTGLDGSNPLGFLAALGVLRVLHLAASRESVDSPSLTFEPGGSWRAKVRCVHDFDGLVGELLADRDRTCAGAVLSLRYLKMEKAGVKPFQGLRVPLPVLRWWLEDRLSAVGVDGALTLLARSELDDMCGLVSELAAERSQADDGITEADLQNAKIDCSREGRRGYVTLPTFFDFTSRNAQYLDQLKRIGSSLQPSSLQRELLSGAGTSDCDREMRWDPEADRPAALFGLTKRVYRSSAEWLAFRGLALLPLFGSSDRASTTACTGRRKDGQFKWPLWSGWCDLHTIKSLLTRRDIDRMTRAQRRVVGVEALCCCALGKAADGYDGIFGVTTFL